MSNTTYMVNADIMWHYRAMKKKQGAYCVSKHIKEAPRCLRNEKEENINMVFMAKDWGHP